jgi:hypothetical protein
LGKALLLLDDQLLPSTSHAVERGNWRYRTRQKQVYRVRTQAQISARLALDMWREAQGAGRHGFDHGVGHSLLLLCDAKAYRGKNSMKSKGLGDDLFNVFISLF